MKDLKTHISEIKSGGILTILTKIKNFINSYTFIILKKFFFIIYLGFIYSSFKKKDFNILNSQKIIFGSVVWGKKFENIYFKFTLSSLLTNKNIPLLIERGFKIKFIIATIPNPTFENQVLNKLQSTLSKDNFEIEFHYYEKMESDKIDQYLIKIYEQSVKEDTIIWPANPDHSYSDGSISNVISMMDSDDCCIAAPIFRVDEDSFLKNFKKQEISFSLNSLIPFSLENLHSSNLLALRKNIGWITGIVFEKINNNYLVTHVVQNIFAARMNQSDIKFFKKHSYDVFDHRWPSKIFLQKRLKLVSTSDLFFSVELTNKDYGKLNKTNDYWNFSNLPLRYNNKRYLHSNIMGICPYFLRVQYEKN